MKRIGGALIAAVLWAALLAPAGAQVAVMCDGRRATIVGTDGDDYLTGTEGPDVIAGLQGEDYIQALGGDDVICGGQGDDWLHGGDGFDIIFGAQGNDRIWARGNDATVTVTGEVLILTTTSTGTALPPDSIEDTRGGRIFAGSGDDIVFGSSRWDRMQGGPGDDQLYGYGGNDWIRGGPGKDRVVGHAGADDLGGGTGNDWMAADKRDTVVRAGAGLDQCPTITSAVKWRGCKIQIRTHPTDPTLPHLTLPAELSGGPADTYVFRGIDWGTGESYLGSSNDLRKTDAELETIGITEYNRVPVTKGQALAIEEALISSGAGHDNKAHAIDPAAPYYRAAVAWGGAWLWLHTPAL